MTTSDIQKLVLRSLFIHLPIFVVIVLFFYNYFIVIFTLMVASKGGEKGLGLFRLMDKIVQDPEIIGIVVPLSLIVATAGAHIIGNAIIFKWIPRLRLSENYWKQFLLWIRAKTSKHQKVR